MNIKKHLKRRLLRWVVHNIWHGFSEYDIIVTETDRKRLREEALYLKNSLLLEYVQKRVTHVSMEKFADAMHPDELIFPKAQIHTVQNLIPKFIDELSVNPNKPTKPRVTPVGVTKRSDETI